MSKSLIHNKLEIFLKKYYTNECIKGFLLFIAIGLLYFFVIIFLEYFLWLNKKGRTVLFILFIIVELLLLFKFIFIPIFYLLQIKKGMNFKDASILIGNYFNSIKDKLYNFIQLSDDSTSSDLLIAALEQKEKELSPIPFNNAINYKKSYSLLPFAIIPVLIYLTFLLSGNSNIINSPFNRILSYNQNFKKPAPFTFKILNSDLNTFYKSDKTIKVEIIGKFLPENISINYNNQSYLLKSTEDNTIFEYTFSNTKKDLIFNFSAQNVFSDDFLLKVKAVPIVSSLQLILNYPIKTNKVIETINGTGNVIVPEGTSITWKLLTQNTESVNFLTDTKIVNFTKENELFTFQSLIKNSLDYSIVTSNKNIKNYEKFNFNISVIKDQFPNIDVNYAPDSLKVSKDYLIGNISDDYGFSKLQLVYFPTDFPNQINKLNLKIKGNNQDTFIYQFPNNLTLKEGINYSYYFEVFDNDSSNNFKSSKSQVFSNKVLTQQELLNENFNAQQSNMYQLSKSLNAQNKQITELDQLQKINKEKKAIDFKDKNKIDDAIKNQINQEKIIEEFSKKLKENLEKSKDNFDKDLDKKLDKTIENSEKNQKLLEELKDLQDKISKEELFDKIDKIKNNSKANNKSLEQLLELTKRFYVEKKNEQLAKKLDKLADKEQKLSEDLNNSKDKQEELNKEFNKISEELQELNKDNKELNKPLDLKEKTNETQDIKEDQQDATKDLEKEDKESAKPKQKKAAKKMKSMASDMKSSMQSSSQEQMEDDAAMLRQILDNLLSFSFNQENLLNTFKNQKKGFPTYNKSLKKQQDLKLQFKHIDDSIFALALRNKMISEKVNNEIAEVHYNTDKAIFEFSDYKISKGVSHQQYIMNASNKLADMLSETLNIMQMQMNGSGKGQGMQKPGSGGGGQLPDIIKKQNSLSKKVKDKLDKKGEEEGDDGEDGKEGEQGKKGEQGKNGEDGQNGEYGQNGEDGEKGKSGSKGKNGNKGYGSKGNYNLKNNDGEQNAKEIFEILQEQKRLRKQLQDMFSKDGLDAKQKKLVDDMKALEKDVLSKGFNNELFKKMLNIQNQMLQLENATNLQEEDTKRESQTNKQSFNNTNKLPDSLLKYIQTNEILQRSNLPFNLFYNTKSNIYFNTND